jgi:hypothetical protein
MGGGWRPTRPPIPEVSRLEEELKRIEAKRQQTAGK